MKYFQNVHNLLIGLELTSNSDNDCYWRLLLSVKISSLHHVIFVYTSNAFLFLYILKPLHAWLSRTKQVLVFVYGAREGRIALLISPAMLNKASTLTVEMHIGMGNMEFLFLPWESRGDGKNIWKWLGEEWEWE